MHAIRSLGRAGVSVLVVTAGEGSGVFGRSRYCSAAVDIDAANAEAFCRTAFDWALDRVPARRPIVVIPFSDRLVSYLHAARTTADPRLVLSIPQPEAAEQLADKERSFGIAEDAGLSVPRWTAVRTADDLPRMEGLNLPIGLRPTAWSTAGSRPIKIVVHRDRRSLVDGAREQLNAGAELIAQEYLDVPEHAVEVGIIWRSRDAKVTVVCTGRKRRHSARAGGVMVWGETTDAPDLVEGAHRFLDRSGFTGLGGIEFIRRRNELLFVEFSPRPEAFHFLANKAGIDTVLMEYRHLATGWVPTSRPTQRGAAVWVGNAWLTRLLNSPGHRWDVALDRWRFARSRGRIRAVWTLSDPLPGIALSGRIGWQVLRRVLGRGRRRD